MQGGNSSMKHKDGVLVTNFQPNNNEHTQYHLFIVPIFLKKRKGTTLKKKKKIKGEKTKRKFLKLNKLKYWQYVD